MGFHRALLTFLFGFSASQARFTGLAFDLLAQKSDSLALIGFGRPQAANLGRDLADLLAIETRDGHLVRLCVNFNFNTVRHSEVDGV